MVDYLAEMIPDIWMTETILPFGSLPDSMTMQSRNKDIPPLTEEMGSSILTEDYSADQFSLSTKDMRPMIQARGGAEAHQDQLSS